MISIAENWDRGAAGTVSGNLPVWVRVERSGHKYPMRCVCGYTTGPLYQGYRDLQIHYDNLTQEELDMHQALFMAGAYMTRLDDDM